MKHLIIVLLGLTCLVSNISAQGIEFMYDLDKALEKAKAENKMVFVDFYTSWCGPCKMLTNDVFPLKEVGDFFNANFINCKIQCDDKGTGPELGKKYKVVAYPTLMFLSKDNEMVHSMAGAPSAEGLIEFAKEAMDPERNLMSLIKQWDSGNREKDFVKKYLKSLKEAYRREEASADFMTYFNGLNDREKQTKELFELAEIVGITPFTPIFSYIEEHIDKYYKVVDQSELDKFISDTYLWNLNSLARNSSDKDFEETMEKFKAKNYPYYDEFAMFCSVFRTELPDGHWNMKEYMRRGTEFLKKYGKNNDAYTISLTSLLGNLTGRPNEGAAGIVWMEDLLARNPDPKYMNTYFYITWRNYQFDKAVEIGKEIRAHAIKSNKSTESIDKQIEQVLAFKQRIEQKESSDKN